MKEEFEEVVKSVYTDGEISGEDFIGSGSRDYNTIIDEAVEKLLATVYKYDGGPSE